MTQDRDILTWQTVRSCRSSIKWCDWCHFQWPCWLL